MESRRSEKDIEDTYQTPSIAHRLLQHLRPADRPCRNNCAALSPERGDLPLELGEERSGIGVRAVDHLLGAEGATRCMQDM